MPDDELPEVDAGVAPGEIQDAMRATYAVLEKLSPDERIAFALRYVDGMELTEVAAACGRSLATIKRVLARAGVRFEAEARRHPVLLAWLEGGTRWATPS
jgi:RNA polymerase sigma-70 factor (ECF subfamily)